MDMRNLWELKGINEDIILRKLSQIKVYDEPYGAVINSHAIAILTEWDEFKDLDYSAIHAAMHQPSILFDGRNLLDLEALRKIGFRAQGIGRA